MRPDGQIPLLIAWACDADINPVSALSLSSKCLVDDSRRRSVVGLQALLTQARLSCGISDFMSEDLLLAAEYRKHAKALRAAAKFDREAKTSMILKRIAEDYEQMAKALEGAPAVPVPPDGNLGRAG